MAVGRDAERTAALVPRVGGAISHGLLAVRVKVKAHRVRRGV
jgi:hypothetical protein